MIVSKWYAPLLTVLTVLASTAAADGLPAAKVTPRERGTVYEPQGYLEYLPAGYGGDERAPLLIDLPGRMESGTGSLKDLAWMTKVGVEGEIAKKRWPAKMPFVVLTPQHGEYKTCPGADEIDAFIQFAKDHYHVDTNKIYLSGLSCGARGIADYLAKYGGKDVAGAVIMSGDLTPAWAKQGCRLAEDVALFVVHGGKDDVIDVKYDRSALLGPRGLLACPNRRDADYLEYPDATHQDPFDWTYARYDKDYFTRLLNSTKAHSAPGALSAPIGAAR